MKKLPLRNDYPPKPRDQITDSYFDLLEKSLINHFYHNLIPMPPKGKKQFRLQYAWSKHSYTGLSRESLRNIRHCADLVSWDNIPGDFLEAGVWRGGACIYMAAIIKAYNLGGRRTFVMDSFEGMPVPNHPNDAKCTDLEEMKNLAISLKEVRENFIKYNVLSDKVVFVQGWFNDTVPTFARNVKNIAILRLDSDLYESTKLLLEHLYDKVPPGGFVIVDDYDMTPCKLAVNQFREERGIEERMYAADALARTGAYWRKS